MQRPNFADIIIALAGMLSLGAAVLAVVLGDWNFVATRRLVIFIALPVVISGLAFAALNFLSVSARLSLAISLIGATVAVYGADAYLAVKSRSDALARAANNSPTRRGVVEELRRQGRDAWPAIPMGFDLSALLVSGDDGKLRPAVIIDGVETLPLGGISGKMTVFCPKDGEYLTYQSDEHGFHNPPGLWRQPLDIAAVGDSFTHGFCVPSEKNMVALIREKYPATLNLGVGGNGPLLTLAGIWEYLPTLEPRFILWFFYEGNDITKDLLMERNSPLLLRYLEQGYSQGLRHKQAAIDESLKARVEQLWMQASPAAEFGIDPVKLKALKGVLLLRHLRHALGLGYGSTDLELFRRVLSEAKRTVSSWNGRLYFVYLPDPRHYQNFMAVWEQEEMRMRVRALVRDLDIPVIDLYEAFRATANPLALYHDRHFNEDGYRLAAEIVLRALPRRGQ